MRLVRSASGSRLVPDYRKWGICESSGRCVIHTKPVKTAETSVNILICGADPLEDLRYPQRFGFTPGIYQVHVLGVRGTDTGFRIRSQTDARQRWIKESCTVVEIICSFAVNWIAA